MQISELSSKVDTLISTAMNIKHAADGQAAQAAQPKDDPEVAALGARIDEAIAVLSGVPRNSGSGETPPNPPPAVDPNAPVV